MAEQMASATGPVALLLPLLGLGEWDREGAELHDKVGLDRFIAELEASVTANVDIHRVDGHINDAIFVDEALRIFDAWRDSGPISGAVTVDV